MSTSRARLDPTLGLAGHHSQIPVVSSGIVIVPRRNSGVANICRLRRDGNEPGSLGGCAGYEQRTEEGRQRAIVHRLTWNSSDLVFLTEPGKRAQRFFC